MLVLPTLVAVIIILWSVFIYHRWNYNRKLAHISGPKGYWFFGNALDFSSIKDLIPVLSKYNNEHDGLAKFSIGLDKADITVSRYSFVEKVLNSSTVITKSDDYLFMKNWLEEGLLTSTREKWQQRRKMLTPAFHFKILEQIVEVFDENTTILTKKLKSEVGHAFDVYPYITLCTLDVITEAAMGIKINAQENNDSEYVKSVKAMAQITLNRSISPWKQFNLLYPLSDDYKREQKALKVLHGTTNSVIRERRDKLEKQGTLEGLVDEFGNKKKLAFLDLLLTANIDGKPLTDKDIREEVDTFMFEGHDTTSSGIGFALYNLGKYPDLQQKVYDEQCAIFQDDMHRALTFKDLQEMRYLELFLKESMRLYPPVPMIGRHLTEDTELDGHVLPKRLNIGLFFYYIMRDDKNFPNPEKFDPERFTPENKSNIKPYAYIPFSAGPRNCIGQKFAMMELKSTISKIIRNFKVLPVEGFTPDLTNELILKSTNGIMVKLENRI